MTRDELRILFLATGSNIQDLAPAKSFVELVPLWNKLKFDGTILQAGVDFLADEEKRLGHTPKMKELYPLFTELGILTGPYGKPDTGWTRGGFILLALIAAHSKNKWTEFLALPATLPPMP